MANSKYEYVKKFEIDDKLPPHNWIVVRIDGCHFHRWAYFPTFILSFMQSDWKYWLLDDVIYKMEIVYELAYSFSTFK